MMRRHPMAVFLYALAGVSGVTYFVVGAAPGSIDRLLPGTLVLSWYLALGVGGGAGIAAAIWRAPLTAVMIERVAMYPLGAAALVYATAIVIRSGFTGLLSALLVAGFGVAALLRAAQITRQLRVLHQAIKAVRDDDH